MEGGDQDGLDNDTEQTRPRMFPSAHESRAHEQTKPPPPGEKRHNSLAAGSRRRLSQRDRTLRSKSNERLYISAAGKNFHHVGGISSLQFPDSPDSEN